MTQLLISVTSIEEAKIALENGADFIDLKDPIQGALGALPSSKVHEIVAFVNSQIEYGQTLTSATIGDLPMQPQLILQHVTDIAKTNVDVIKIGFFSVNHYRACLDALKPMAVSGVKLIAVLFAEYDYPPDVLLDIKNARFYGVMIDTVEKNGATFFDYYSETNIIEFAKNIHKYDLLFGLAGSLTLQHIVSIKKINPSYVGFRGGVCTNNQRILSLSGEKIRAIHQKLSVVL